MIKNDLLTFQIEHGSEIMSLIDKTLGMVINLKHIWT